MSPQIQIEGPTTFLTVIHLNSTPCWRPAYFAADSSHASGDISEVMDRSWLPPFYYGYQPYTPVHKLPTPGYQTHRHISPYHIPITLRTAPPPSYHTLIPLFANMDASAVHAATAFTRERD